LKVTDVSLPEAAADADLGGSSKYSSEILEGQCGEGCECSGVKPLRVMKVNVGESFGASPTDPDVLGFAG